MKQLTLITALLFGFIMLFVSCTKEGEPGADGADGADGEDGTTTCIECHDDDQTISSRQFQWESSAHAAGSAITRSSSSSCSSCHSHQGFMLSDGNNIETKEDWQGVDDPLLITCYTCHPIHSTHTYADVEQLNYSDQPTWHVTYDKTVDMDLGKGNTCAHCHQSREREPVVDMDNLDATYTGISTHYGPHYSSQANLMGGFGAYEIEGSTAYPSSNYHGNATDGCVSCHMRFNSSAGSGGHNMHIDADSDLEESCAQCHSSGAEADAKYKTYYKEVFATLNADGTEDSTSYYSVLGDLLVEKGVYTKVVDEEGVHYNINRNLEINGTLTAALFNHRYLYQDHSHGIHNPAYAKALLKNSIEAVEAL